MESDTSKTEAALDDAGLPTEGDEAAVEAIRGARFISRYGERSHMHRLHPMRLWRLLVGLGLLAFGIFNIFVPGPGGSVIILAALLVLAGESRMLASLLDLAEVRFQRQIDWALTHKIAAMLIISTCAFGGVATLGYIYTRLH